jgi:hypothetical protein
MTSVNSLDIIVPKIRFSIQVKNKLLSVMKDEKFRKAFIKGLVFTILTGFFTLFGGNLRRAFGCQFPENAQNIYEIKQKRTWYQWSKSFFTLQIAGKVLGLCTGLILLRALHCLDFEIKKSAKLKSDFDRATAYIELLIQSCVKWED